MTNGFATHLSHFSGPRHATTATTTTTFDSKQKTRRMADVDLYNWIKRYSIHSVCGRTQFSVVSFRRRSSRNWCMRYESNRTKKMCDRERAKRNCNAKRRQFIRSTKTHRSLKIKEKKMSTTVATVSLVIIIAVCFHIYFLHFIFYIFYFIASKAIALFANAISIYCCLFLFSRLFSWLGIVVVAMAKQQQQTCSTRLLQKWSHFVFVSIVFDNFSAVRTATK